MKVNFRNDPNAVNSFRIVDDEERQIGRIGLLDGSWEAVMHDVVPIRSAVLGEVILAVREMWR